MLASAPAEVRAESSVATLPPQARFALIIGVNASSDPETAALRYADDDAARYFDLFRALGAHSHVLSRLDENTLRLHPETAQAVKAPTRLNLQRAVEALRKDIEQARANGYATTLYVTYAGHGGIEDTSWYLTLEDRRLRGEELLSEVVGRAGADHSHVIVDACYAQLLALSRGPGGARRPLTGFVKVEAASHAGPVGYVLSNSASGESHEWAGFEAGVFSHEVRSGLYGAADADSDGRVSYAELGAFIARANQLVSGERFRPHVLVSSPAGDDSLLDLRMPGDRRLILDGPDSGSHYLVENERGVRVLDFHGSGAQAVQLLRPPGSEALYLRNLSDDSERRVPASDGVVRLSKLPSISTRVQTRGAAQHAFNRIFALPFDASVVRGWSVTTAAWRDFRAKNDIAQAQASQRAHELRISGAVALGTGAAVGAAAGIIALSAHMLRASSQPNESQSATAARNREIEARNDVARALTIGAATVGVAGAVLVLWPAAPAKNSFTIAPIGTGVSADWRF